MYNQKNNKINENIANINYIYASKEGIFTLIHQYLYETIVLEEKDLVKNLKEFILIELDHLEILGKYIYNAGVLPIFALQNGLEEKYWHTNTIYYDDDKKTIIAINIELLQKIIGNLQIFYATVTEPNIKRIIKNIIRDGYKELNYFTKLSF